MSVPPLESICGNRVPWPTLLQVDPLGIVHQQVGIGTVRRSCLYSERQPWEIGHHVSLAYPCATSPCTIRKSTAHKSDIGLEDDQRLRRPETTLNILDSDSIAWETSRVTSCDTTSNPHQEARTRNGLRAGRTQTDMDSLSNTFSAMSSCIPVSHVVKGQLGQRIGNTRV